MYQILISFSDKNKSKSQQFFWDQINRPCWHGNSIVTHVLR